MKILQISANPCGVGPHVRNGFEMRLQPFFDFYRNITAYYLPDTIGSSNPALRSHADLRDVIALLKKHADQARMQVTDEYFDGREREEGRKTPPNDQKRAFNLAARIITMIQPAAENQSDGLLEAGAQPVLWPSEKSLADFISSVFPKREYPSLSQDSDVAATAKIPISSITAKRLKKVAKLKIVPTNDLSGHLSLDKKNGTVSIFHYTSVLKEHLVKVNTPAEEGTQSSSRVSAVINIRSNMPPQLALETLATIKDVLFPDDQISQSMLRNLVSRDKFDPDIARIFNARLHLNGTNAIVYAYWGSRLMDLYEELENPTPRGYFEKWLERKSGGRYVMMATLAGVLIAILLGVFSLAVSIFQAWVGWQQWQHPQG
ncbi:Fc.00g004130.m01.CDS01 [Cosmosporella sp. VM-42]